MLPGEDSGERTAVAEMLFATKEAKMDERFDAVVIGAGVVGCCTARELARYQLKVLVLEAGLDIACGATRANSGIVHAGFDPRPGTLKARYNVRGAALFPQWQRDLGFAYFPNGALVLAFDQDDLATLERLRQQGVENGATETRIIGQEELRALEPQVSPDAIGALFAPQSGVCDPYGLTLGAAENAAENGVEFRFDCPVTGVFPDENGYVVETPQGVVHARAVVNAAGIHADEINNMVSATKLAIRPVRGEYHLYNNEIRLFNHTLFQAPTPAGKGVLVASVAFGNMICGPNAMPQESKDNLATTAEGLAEVLEKAARVWPGATAEGVISNFAGLRAKNAQGDDFVVGFAPDAPGFFNLACIDSPGLASAPALAEDASSQVAAYLGSDLRQDFNPVRVPAPLLAFMPPEAVEGLVAQDPAFGRSVCGCCHVSEGELVAALHRSLPVLSLDALKWRTGATMGPCQGGRCMARILAIICREQGISLEEAQKRMQGSSLVAAGAAPAAEAVEALLASELPAEFEKPRSAYAVAGSRPAGVYAATTVMDLLALGAVPGKVAVVWGNAPLASQCAQALNGAGVQVMRVLDTDLTCVYGADRLEAVEFDGQRVACDLLVVAREMQQA